MHRLWLVCFLQNPIREIRKSIAVGTIDIVNGVITYVFIGISVFDSHTGLIYVWLPIYKKLFWQ